jgi:predicted RNase H-like HicB family nuclease
MRDQAIAVESMESGPRNLILLTLELTQEDDVWVGTCIELGTSAYADTLDELRGEIADAIGLQLNEAMRLGFIDEYIQERNVRTLPLIQLQEGYPPGRQTLSEGLLRHHAERRP